MLAPCWTTGFDPGPILSRHRVNISYLQQCLWRNYSIDLLIVIALLKYGYTGGILSFVAYFMYIAVKLNMEFQIKL